MAGRLKWRPPLRTSEILAYNWGRAAKRDGTDLGEIYPLDNFPPVRALTGRELEALARLGPDAWQKWAARGWAEFTPPEALN